MFNSGLITFLSIFMIALGTGFIYFIVRENEKPVPQGGVQWAATSLSVLLIVFSGFLLVLTRVTMTEGPVVDVTTQAHPDDLNQKAEDFSFRLVASDEKHSLSDFKGKVVLLNLWATWCAPCISELPELNNLQEDYSDAGLVVLTISDEMRDELVAFEDFLPLKTVSGYISSPEDLPQPFQRTLAIRPSSYIIDREGYIRMFFQGAGDYNFFEQAVSPYLQENMATR